MIHKCRTLKLFTVLLFLSILLLSGCIDQTDNTLTSREETESVSTLDAVPVANLEERTFSKLRAAFPGPLLDENLKTLQALANSDIYLYPINLIRSLLIKSALRGTGTSHYKWG